MAVRDDYEVSSEHGGRHWEFSQARLENTSPTVTQPAAVLSRTAGDQITGTVIGVDNDADIALIDVDTNMVYKHYVRNVRTYSGGAEATFGAINEGDTIYYDRSSTLPTDVHLSTSPLDKDGAANPKFGRAVLMNEDDTLPKGSTSASTQSVGVMQIGAGAG